MEKGVAKVKMTGDEGMDEDDSKGRVEALVYASHTAGVMICWFEDTKDARGEVSRMMPRQ